MKRTHGVYVTRKICDFSIPCGEHKHATWEELGSSSLKVFIKAVKKRLPTVSTIQFLDVSSHMYRYNLIFYFIKNFS